MKPDGTGLMRRHLDRKTPWRLVKKYCRAAGTHDRLGRIGGGHEDDFRVAAAVRRRVAQASRLRRTYGRLV